MPISIDQTFEDVANGMGSWRKAFVCTEMLVEGKNGFVICPPPQKDFIYESYKYKLNVLLKHPNNDSLYNEVVETLIIYIQEWEENNQI